MFWTMQQCISRWFSENRHHALAFGVRADEQPTKADEKSTCQYLVCDKMSGGARVEKMKANETYRWQQNVRCVSRGEGWLVYEREQWMKSLEVEVYAHGKRVDRGESRVT